MDSNLTIDRRRHSKLGGRDDDETEVKETLEG